MDCRKIRVICNAIPDCKLKLAIQDAGKKLLPDVNSAKIAPLENDVLEVSSDARIADMLKVRDEYIAQNPDSFITLDHIKSNYDNSYLYKSITKQTPKLDAISTDDFCNLSEIMKNIRLPHRTTVYRGFGTQDFNLGNISPEEFLAKYYKEGKQITVPIYMSTSLDRNVAYDFVHKIPGRMVFKLNLEKGTPAIYMEKLAPGDAAHFNNEQEINVIKNSIIRFGKVKQVSSPIDGKPVYEIEGTVVGFVDVPPPPPKEVVFDDDMMSLLNSLKQL